MTDAPFLFSGNVENRVAFPGCVSSDRTNVIGTL
ncbi:MAG: hypothetical protein QOJ04_344, partial [Caballeronia sp.]|nr:hypothetical protein [Caballeronia sp.]